MKLECRTGGGLPTVTMRLRKWSKGKGVFHVSFNETVR